MHSHTNWGKASKSGMAVGSILFVLRAPCIFPTQLQPPFFINGPDVAATHGDVGGGGGGGGGLITQKTTTQRNYFHIQTFW